MPNDSVGYKEVTLFEGIRAAKKYNTLNDGRENWDYYIRRMTLAEIIKYCKGRSYSAPSLMRSLEAQVNI